MARFRNLLRSFADAATGRQKQLPQDLVGVIAGTDSGQDITQPFMSELKEPRDRRLWGAVDWGIYDKIRKDDQVKATMEQRIRALVGRDWGVRAGDDKDPRSVEAAEKFKANLERIGWDRVTEKMAWGVFYGYSAAEFIWEVRDGLLQWSDIRVRHARRFRIDKNNRWRLLTTAALTGTVVPDRKFWFVTTGATNDDEPYGEGLADWLYWPTWFKRNGIRFWNVFLDKFGQPTAVGTYRPGMSKEDRAKLLSATIAWANAAGITIPEGTKIDLLEASRSGTGSFEELCRYMDAAISKIVLSQTMTTDSASTGLGSNQANVHNDVKLEIVKADADLLSDGFNSGPARWWTDLNYGPDVAAPTVWRDVQEPTDRKAEADTDTALKEAGWVRTEESFKDTYGDGYERAPEPAPPVAGNPLIGHNGGPALDDAQPRRVGAVSFALPDALPLYVERKLSNADELIAWARGQGFKNLVSADDLHVTITYSRKPVDWFSMGGTWGPVSGSLEVAPGGPRVIDTLGQDNVVVLFFGSDELSYRHDQMVDAGASWDFPQYRPHITFATSAAGVDLSTIEPYQGRLVFGPEQFEKLDTDWTPTAAASFSEPAARDAIDDVVDRLISETGFQALSPLMAPIADAVARSGSAEDLDDELIQALGQADVDKLTEALARAGFAVRVAAETGQGNPEVGA